MSHAVTKFKLLLQAFMRELLFLEHPKQGIQIVVTLPNGNTIGAMKMSENLKIGQFEDLKVRDVDAAGNQTDLSPGQTPSLVSSDTSVIGLTIAPDGVSIRATGLKVGTSTVTATVGAFTATCEFTVAVGDPVGIVIIPGAVQNP